MALSKKLMDQHVTFSLQIDDILTKPLGYAAFRDIRVNLKVDLESP